MFQAMTLRFRTYFRRRMSLCLIVVVFASANIFIGYAQTNLQALSSLPLMSKRQTGAGQNPQEVTALASGKARARELAGGQKHSYRIPFDKGQYAKVIVEQRGIDVIVRLLRDGKLFAEFDSETRGQGKEEVELVAEEAGSYSLNVEAKLQKAPAASYTISLVEIRAATEPDHSLQQARMLFAQSRQLRREGKYAESLASGEKVREIREKLLGVNHPEVARSLNHLGNLLFEKSDYVKAEPLYQRALEIRKKALGGDHPSVAQTLNDLAVLYLRRGDTEKAESLHRQALEIRERGLGANHLDVAASLINLGNLTLDKGDYPSTETFYRRALEIRERVLGADHLQVADSLNNLAILYSDDGDNSKAEPLYQRALIIYEKELPPDHPTVASILENLSILYYETGDYARAEPLYRRVLATREKALGADHILVAASLTNLGSLQDEKGDYAEAEMLHRRALEIREKRLKADHPLIAQSLNKLGKVYYHKGEFAKAEALYQQSLAILEKSLGADHPNMADPLSGLANIYTDAGEYAKAEPLYQRALQIYDKMVGADHPNKVTLLTSLATLYAAKGNFSQAVTSQLRANTIAERNIALSLTTGSESRKLAYLNSLSEVYDRTLSLHTGSAPDNKEAGELAVTAVLQRKGRVLDAMSNSLATLHRRSSEQDRELLNQLNDKTARLARLVLNGPQKRSLVEHQGSITSLEEERERLESEVSRRSAGFYEPTEPVTLRAVQAAIPTDAALIELSAYHPLALKAGSGKDTGKSHYVAYVLRRQGKVQWKELGEIKPIDEAVEALRRALRDPTRTDVQEFARLVDEKVMKPLRALVGDATQLLISPDRTLNLIPFEVLVDEQKRYLVEHYSFTYLTSGRDLLRLQVARQGKGTPLIIADPLFGEPEIAQGKKAEVSKTKASPLAKRRQSVTTGSDLSTLYFASLGGTAQEASIIKTLFPEANVLTGQQASESIIKRLSAPRLLHIATHGFFLQDTADTARSAGQGATRGILANARIENPLLRSGLALAGANLRGESGDDGILTALEASGLNLWGTKLVTLSACDTGIGEVKAGEGVYGLRRAFVLAGAESLVMSLWPVSDYVTREMMTAYYKGLRQGQGRGEALRQVQLAMLSRKERQHPFYWASFIHSGEWANLDGRR